MLNLFKSQVTFYTLLLYSKELHCSSIFHQQNGNNCTLNLHVTSGSNLSMPSSNFTNDILSPNFIYLIFKVENYQKEQCRHSSSVSDRFLQYCHILLVDLSQNESQSVNERKISNTLLVQNSMHLFLLSQIP